MTELVTAKAVDAVFDQISCEPSTAQELYDHFSFMIPNARFDPRVRNKVWDGRIRLFNIMRRRLYRGLRDRVREFCRSRGYEFEELDGAGQEFSLVEANAFIDTLKLPERFNRRDYQVAVFAKCVRDGRALILSPTASGKSFMIYLLLRYFSNARTLLIVPRVSLVEQMLKDFIDYGGPDISDDVHGIYSGKEKNTGQRITVSTWQSLQRMPAKWFQQFDMIIGDEAHGCKAKELTRILEVCSEAELRFGFTGTLDGALSNEMVLVGLFGPIHSSATTRELMDQGHVAQIKIKCIVLEYDDEHRQRVAGMDYHDELVFIREHDGRMRFITNLALSLQGNTIVLYRFVETHGEPLYEAIKAKAGDRKVFYVSGKVDADEREEIRQITMTETNAIIVASIGTFAEGINIPNLENAIFAAPWKGRIKTLQSIGRILRPHESKDYAKLYDVVDDLKWKSRKNYALNHFIERVKIYAAEDFPYKLYRVRLKG